MTTPIISPLPYTGERAIPWQPSVGLVMHHHAARYAWALQFVEGAAVVDLACGVGYGSYMLSWLAEKVVGVDIDVYAIDYARSAFRARNLDFLYGDITQGVPDGDVYIAFECLEHVDNPADVLGLVKPNDSMLIWSMPVNDGSRFHKRAYSVKDIRSMTGCLLLWYQSEGGDIVPEGHEWFEPQYVLGVL